MARLTLTVLGGFEARVDDRPVATLPAKARALLAYLALHPVRASSRDTLAALLWGGMGHEQALRNLRHTVFTIRRTLAVAQVFPQGHGLRLEPGTADVDALRFEEFAGEDATPDALRTAAALYRGDLLEGLRVSEPPFEEWLIAERERLRELAVRALGRLLVHESNGGATQGAIQTANRLLALDPLQEAVHRTLMRLYARQGRRTAALKQYQTCAEVLQRELRAQPESETRQLHQELLDRREEDLPQPRGVRIPSPQPLSSGVDRATEPAGRDESRQAQKPEQERKQVTVLFADLEKSMEVALGRDPEDARALLDPLLERMIAAIRRYGGTVNAVHGDGIMALFGAPRAQEDHAVRACYAALHLQEAIKHYAAEVERDHGLQFRVRVGLNSGEVVVRSIEADLYAAYRAVGSATHLGALIEQLATPGTIRITAETRRLVQGFVETRSLGFVPVKGLHEPIEVYEVIGVPAARTRVHAAGSLQLTRFVGRAAELQVLERALEETRAGRGRIQTVIGEPGVGKSRLLHELAHAPRARGWRILETGGVAYGQGMAYLPVIALLRSYLGIENAAPPEEVARTIREVVLALDRALEPVLPALAALLDAPVDDREWSILEPMERRRRTLDGVKRLLLRLSRERPLLLICEDLHWIDAETQALLESLVESLPGTPLLLLVTYRPGFEHRWGSREQYRQLRLETLPPADTEAILDALLGSDVSLRSVKRSLVERVGGNPLFIEESVRSLVETGTLGGARGAYHLATELGAIKVPATVQAVLAARIDRLSSDAKRLLQTAAVIGQEAPLPLLLAMSDVSHEVAHHSLAQLQEAELVCETAAFPDGRYAFKHALTQDVAYGSLVKERRRALHARVVDAIETLYWGNLAEHLERLAHHAARAELGEKAVHYLRRSATKALDRHALRQALAWFDQALSALSRLPASRAVLEQEVDIRLERHHLLCQFGDYRVVQEHVKDLERLADQLGDDGRRGAVYKERTNVSNHRGDLDDAAAWCTRALEIADRLGDLRLRLGATTMLEQNCFMRGEHGRVIALATANLAAVPPDALHERIGSLPTSVYDRGWLVRSLAELGRFTEAVVPAREGVEIALQTRRPYSIAWASYCAGNLDMWRGDWTAAQTAYQRGIDELLEAGVATTLANLTATSAWALACLGEADAATERADEAERLLQAARAASRLAGNSWSYVWLCRAYVRLGRVADAARGIVRVLEPRTTAAEAYAWYLRGEIGAVRPDRETPEACYARAIDLANTVGLRPLAAHCHLGLGTVHGRAGRRDNARAELAIAIGMYREMGIAFWQSEAERELGITSSPR